MAPSSTPQGHTRCFIQPPRPPRQSHLVLTPQSLRYERPPRIYPPRSPLPHAVRRITHEPFFSTSDHTLTSFLRFPYDIRVQIYEYLLLCDRVLYSICIQTCRFVMICEWYDRKYPFKRHGLFPSILECCRLINEEGSQILYSRNQFTLSCKGIEPQLSRTLNSWPLGEHNLRRMTKVDMGALWGRPIDPLPGDALRSCSGRFSKLKAIKMSLVLSPSDWERFLEDGADCLKKIPKVNFKIFVPLSYCVEVWRKHSRLGEDGRRKIIDIDGLCLKLYQPATKRLSEKLGKRITWSSHDQSDDYGPHVELGLLWEDFGSSPWLFHCNMSNNGQTPDDDGAGGVKTQNY